MTTAERQRRHRQLMAQRKQEEDMTGDAILKVAPPLPATRDELRAGYKLKRRRNINDLVEEVFVKLWEVDQPFMKLLEPIYDSEAIEGSIDDNYSMAALTIRAIAKKDNHVEVAATNLHTIKLALKVVLRRFGQDVPEREGKAEYPVALPSPVEEATP
jgi:hypothetical protein